MGDVTTGATLGQRQGLPPLGQCADHNPFEHFVLFAKDRVSGQPSGDGLGLGHHRRRIGSSRYEPHIHLAHPGTEAQVHSTLGEVLERGRN